MIIEEIDSAITPTPDHPIPVDTQQAISTIMNKLKETEYKLLLATKDLYLVARNSTNTCYYCLYYKDCKMNNTNPTCSYNYYSNFKWRHEE